MRNPRLRISSSARIIRFITVSETVETIHMLAFHGCRKLSLINISDRVLFIGLQAFRYVPAEIKIPYNCDFGDNQGCINSVILAAHISPKNYNDDIPRAAMTRGFVNDERRTDVPKEIYKDYKTEIRNSFKQYAKEYGISYEEILYYLR